MLTAADLRANALVTPLALPPGAVRLTWSLASERRGEAQSAWRVRVAGSAEALDGGELLHDSGERGDGEPVALLDLGHLAEAERCHWRVEVRAAAGDWSASAASWWEWAPGERLAAAEWIAAPASLRPRPAAPLGGVDPASWHGTRPTVLARDVELPGPVRRARLHVTALGLYAATIGGEPVGDALLTPGWTEFARRIEHQTYDVTALLAPGCNRLEVALADGWYAGRIAWETEPQYGAVPALLALLEVALEEGGTVVVASDGAWRAAPSALLWSDLLMGEALDAREPAAAGLDPLPVEVLPPPACAVVPQVGPPVRRLAELPGSVLGAEPAGDGRPAAVLWDLGQNIAGTVRVELSAGAAAEVRLRYGEALDADGRLYVENLRSAAATDVVLLGDGRALSWEPTFTFHGFRYVEVSGPDDVAQRCTALTGVAIGSDTPEAGGFACSSPLLGKLVENVRWSRRGNFLAVPTDCPQRDERLGWMADAQIFARTAAWTADVEAFFAKWLVDVEDARLEAGGVYADVAPLFNAEEFAPGSAGWADAGVLIPRALYDFYGDRATLARAYPGMRAWLAHLLAHNPDHRWREARGYDYGDWLAVGEETPKDLLADACWANVAAVVAEVGEILGHEKEAAADRRTAAAVRAAFAAEHLGADGVPAPPTQTACAMALVLGLVPESARERTAATLVADVERRGGRLATGFLGTPFLMEALAAAGRLDVAYRLLESTEMPSWGFSIVHGATTIWEHWNGWTPEDGFQDPQMNSFNHYSFGAVVGWMYEHVAGLRATAPGFAAVRVAPRPGGTLRWARATHRCPRGELAAGWSIDGETLKIEACVPPGVRALVELPAAVPVERLRESGEDVRAAAGVEPAVDGDGLVARLRCGSGAYRFELPWPSSPPGAQRA